MQYRGMKKYVKPVRCSRKELEGFLVGDLIVDAEFAEKQANVGPLYPELGITKESLLCYAGECRRMAETPARTLSGIQLKFFTPGRDC